MRTLGALAAGVLLLAGCASGDEEPEPTDTTAAEEPTGSGETEGDDGGEAVAGDFGECGSTWDEVLAAAEAEGEVVMYSTRSEDDNAAVLDAFMQAYPEINASSVRLVGGDMISRVDQEMAADSLAADLLIHAERQWAQDRVDAGDLVVPSGPATELWEGAEEFWENGVVQIAAEPWVIGYNTDLVTEAPTDWDSLVGADEFTGQVGLNEVSGLTVAIWYDFILQTAGDDYFERLAERDPIIYPNSAPLTQALGSGELAWAPYSLVSTINPLVESGAPIGWVVPESGTWALVRDAMMVEGGPNPCAGRVLMDYMMSQEGQQLWNGSKSGFSVAPGVEVEDAIEFDQSLVTYVDYGDYTEEDLTEMRQMVDDLFR